MLNIFGGLSCTQIFDDFTHRATHRPIQTFVDPLKSRCGSLLKSKLLHSEVLQIHGMHETVFAWPQLDFEDLTCGRSFNLYVFL